VTNSSGDEVTWLVLDRRAQLLVIETLRTAIFIRLSNVQRIYEKCSRRGDE